MAKILWNELIPLDQDRGFEVYHRDHPTVNMPAFHSHEFYEIYIYLTGTATMVIEGYEQALVRGNMYIIPPGHMHRAVHQDTCALYERVFLYVSRDCMRDMGSGDFSILKILDGRTTAGHYRFHLSEAELKDIVQQADSVIAGSGEGDPARVLINRCRFNMMLAWIAEKVQEAAEEDSALPLTRMGEVISYLNDNLSRDHRLDELAERFYLSKYYLLHEFRRHTNTSIYQYLLSKRIIYAKILLQQGQSPGSASRACGFRDYSCFYRAFKKETRISPQQYISHLRKQAEDGHGQRVS